MSIAHRSSISTAATGSCTGALCFLRWTCFLRWARFLRWTCLRSGCCSLLLGRHVEITELSKKWSSVCNLVCRVVATHKRWTLPHWAFRYRWHLTTRLRHPRNLLKRERSRNGEHGPEPWLYTTMHTRKPCPRSAPSSNQEVHTMSFPSAIVSSSSMPSYPSNRL